MGGFEYIETGGAPIRAWTRGVPIEDAARQQIENVARLPFIHKHVAIMPDVHWGRGAVRTNVAAADLPDSLGALRSAIEAAVPHGRTDNGGRADIGAWPGD